MDRCPICLSELSIDGRETIRPTWFWGNYRCPNHGLMRMSGKIKNGKRELSCLLPACPRHGIDHVVSTDPPHGWMCLYWGCNRAIRLEGRKFMVREFVKPAERMPSITMDGFAAEYAPA